MADSVLRPDLLTFNIAETVDWYGFRALPDNLPEHRRGMYLLLHLQSGKPYVGIAQDVWVRDRAHAKGNSPNKLRTAIAKHGKQAFLIAPLFYVLDEAAPLEEIETATIDTFDAIRRGYNICAAKGRVGPYGPAHSAAVRAGFTPAGRASQAEAARTASAAIAAMHAAAKIVNSSPEGKKVLSDRAVRLWQDPAWRADVIAKIKATKAKTKVQRSEKIRISWLKRRQRALEADAQAQTTVQLHLDLLGDEP